jgi:aryl-alcohol dehydrogenase-like predicted oxidoreductase
LLRVAESLGRTPAEVALAWVMSRPCVTSTLIGATRVEQLEKNLAAASLILPQDAISELSNTSAPEPNELDHFFGDVLQAMIHGDARVERTVF